jgi:hypothetical protein
LANVVIVTEEIRWHFSVVLLLAEFSGDGL